MVGEVDDDSWENLILDFLSGDEEFQDDVGDFLNLKKLEMNIPQSSLRASWRLWIRRPGLERSAVFWT